MSLAPTTIQRLAEGVPQALAMLAAMELGVFTPLKNERLTCEQLSSVLGVRADKLQPLLVVLVSAGLLEAENKRFANSPEASRYLVKWQPSYMGSVWLLWSDMWHGELKTAQSVRTGIPQANHDFSRMSFKEIMNFLGGSEPGARAAARLLMQA